MPRVESSGDEENEEKLVVGEKHHGGGAVTFKISSRHMVNETIECGGRELWRETFIDHITL